jgi:hypothetical protein
MPLALRNQLSNMVMFENPAGGPPYTWQPAGNPGGEDVQYLPDEMKTNIDIIRDIKRGIFKIEAEDEDSIESLLNAQVSREQAAAASQPQNPYMDQNAKNVMLGFQCLGPGVRNTGQCENQVILRQADAKTRPPLCPSHQNLAPQFVTVEGGGWVRVQ